MRLKRLEGELASFLESMFSGLGRVERRRAMDWYVKGLRLEGERKSIEPMAGRLVEQPSEKEAMRQRLITAVALEVTGICDDCGDPDMALLTSNPDTPE
ncbi:hypothetical protein WA016_06023 [Myxococcus stipitatus]